MQIFGLDDGVLRYEVIVNIARSRLGVAHCMAPFPSQDLLGVGVVVGQGESEAARGIVRRPW